MAPHVRAQSVPRSVCQPLPRAVVPLAGVLCAPAANVLVVDVLHQVVHVAHVVLAAVPAAHGDLLGVVKVVVASAAGGARDRARGVGGDVGVAVDVRTGRVVVGEERRVGGVGEGDGGGAFGGAWGRGGGGGVHGGEGGEGGGGGHGGVVGGGCCSGGENWGDAFGSQSEGARCKQWRLGGVEAMGRRGGGGEVVKLVEW